MNTLDTWGAHFPTRQIFTGFFDDISAKPEQLLQDIYRFLQLDASSANLPEDIRKPVNVGNRRVARAIPPRILELLIDLYRDDMIALSQRFGGVTDNWLRAHASGTEAKAGN